MAIGRELATRVRRLELAPERLERRTRALLFDPDQGLGGVDEVAGIMARKLGWSAERTAAEIDHYRRLAATLRSFP